MHRTLKAEATRPPAPAMRSQQMKFDRFRREFNTERPHEALDLAVPASRYRQSRRDYAETPPPFDYAPGDIVRRVQQGGRVSLNGRRITLPKAFKGKPVAFRPTGQDGVFEVAFRHQTIATVDLRTHKQA